MKKLNSQGFSHDLIAVIIVVIFAISGVAYIVASHADQCSTSSACVSKATTTAPSAPTTNKTLYKCGPQTVSAIKLPTPPPAPSGIPVTKVSYPSVCPSGQVPMPTALAGIKGDADKFSIHHRLSTSTSATAHNYSQNQYGYNYSYSIGQQNVVFQGATSLFSQLQIQQPYVSPYYTSDHSLGQIWALDYSNPAGFSDVETGWSVSLGQFGNYTPHLFIYHFDQSVPMGYAPSGGWVQLSKSIYPNMPFPHGSTLHWFGVQRYGSVWLVYYDGSWVGYYPASSFPRYFPQNLTELEVGGEVAAAETNTCTDMGDAYRGNVGIASQVRGTYWNNGSGAHNANLSPFNSDPWVYSSGNWQTFNNGFNFGGPGFC